VSWPLRRWTWKPTAHILKRPWDNPRTTPVDVASITVVIIVQVDRDELRTHSSMPVSHEAMVRGAQHKFQSRSHGTNSIGIKRKEGEQNGLTAGRVFK
jgi:hypothetical protein